MAQAGDDEGSITTPSATISAASSGMVMSGRSAQGNPFRFRQNTRRSNEKHKRL
jgi:tRNA-dihydrouridine synthase